MAFQKLTQLFLIRKFAAMLGLVGNVGGKSLYVRLAHWESSVSILPRKAEDPFSLSRFEQEPLTRPIISAKAVFFDKEESMWTWSSTPPILMGWHWRFFKIRAIYA
jgi:hypothetical protein